MTPEITIAAISGFVAISVAIITKTELLSRKHHGLMKDIELYSTLPADSSKKNDLLRFIDRRVGEYIKASKDHRRNGTEISIGVIFLVIGGYLTWFFFNLGSWWLVGLLLSGSSLLIGTFGLIQGIKKVERDEKGNAIPKFNEP